jgi:hypothetical protein
VKHPLEPSSSLSTAGESRSADGLSVEQVQQRLGRSHSWVTARAKELGGRRIWERQGRPFRFDPVKVEAKAEELRAEGDALAELEAEKATERESRARARAAREREAAEIRERREEADRERQARVTAQERALPWRAVRAEDVAWTALSPTAKETLAMLAVPISLGLTQAQVSERTGLTLDRVAERMRALRAEIRAQLERDPAER